MSRKKRKKESWEKVHKESLTFAIMVKEGNQKRMGKKGVPIDNYRSQKTMEG